MDDRTCIVRSPQEALLCQRTWESHEFHMLESSSKVQLVDRLQSSGLPDFKPSMDVLGTCIGSASAGHLLQNAKYRHRLDKSELLARRIGLLPQDSHRKIVDMQVFSTHIL